MHHNMSYGIVISYSVYYYRNTMTGLFLWPFYFRTRVHHESYDYIPKKWTADEIIEKLQEKNKEVAS